MVYTNSIFCTLVYLHVDKNGNNTCTTIISTKKEEELEPVDHVAEFTATALSGTSIKVSWNDAPKVDKYVILAKTGGGVFTQVNDGTQIDDDTNWNDNNGCITSCRSRET